MHSKNTEADWNGWPIVTVLYLQLGRICIVTSDSQGFVLGVGLFIVLAENE